MMNPEIVTCTNIKNDNGWIRIEYKKGRSVRTMTTAVAADDYDIAKTLTVGDKFMIAERKVILKSVGSIQAPDNPETTIPYIVKKITR